MKAAQEVPYMMQQYHRAVAETDGVGRAGAADAEAWLRRVDQERTDDSVRRMRDAQQNDRERALLADSEDRLQRRERDIDRHEADLRQREDALLAERKRSLQTLSTTTAAAAAAAASPRRRAPPSPPQIPAELMRTITSLQDDNKELRSLIKDIKEGLHNTTTTTTTTPAKAAPPTADPPLSAKVRGVLYAAGLMHYSEVFREHQMDDVALRHATEDDLADLGLTPTEQVKLLNVISGVSSPSPPTAPTHISYSAPISPERFSPAGTITAADAGFHREVLTAFYTKLDPQKVGHVDFLLQDLQGSVEDIYPTLVDAYALERSVFTPNIAEVLGFGKAGAAPVLAALWRDREVELLSKLSGRPCDWVELRDRSGQAFYFSNTFNVSQWARPVALVGSDALLVEGQRYASHLNDARSVGIRPEPCSLNSPVFASEGRQRTPSHSPPRRINERDQHNQAWVTAYLEKHAPHRLCEINDMFARHSPSVLVDLLLQQYG